MNQQTKGNAMNSTQAREPNSWIGDVVTLVFASMPVGVLFFAMAYALGYFMGIVLVPLVPVVVVLIAYVAACVKVFRRRRFMAYCVIQWIVGVWGGMLLLKMIGESFRDAGPGESLLLIMGVVTVSVSVALVAMAIANAAERRRTRLGSEMTAGSDAASLRGAPIGYGLDHWMAVALHYLVFAGCWFAVAASYGHTDWRMHLGASGWCLLGYPIAHLVIFRRQRFTFNSLGHLVVFPLAYWWGRGFRLPGRDTCPWGESVGDIVAVWQIFIIVLATMILLLLKPEIVKLFNACFSRRENEVGANDE